MDFSSAGDKTNPTPNHGLGPATEGPPSLDEAIPGVTAAVQQVDGSTKRPLDALLRSWRSELLWFRGQMDLPRDAWDNPKVQHRHDWLGAILLRSKLQERLESLGTQVPPEVHAWLRDVDNYMRSFTETVPGWWEEAQPFQPTPEQWWWNRLPTHGPVRAGWWAEG